ncbi:MAG: nucleoside triphosphate pyrophosphohydrolase [Candidatus Saccharimonadales bacterium]
MPKFIFNKLVRDKLPELYESIHQKITVRALSSGEYSAELCTKLVEEARELSAAHSKDAVINELADIYQVAEDLMVHYNIEKAQVDKIKTNKKADKGSFSEGVFVETIELAENDKWVDYYRRNPKKYPEI